MKHYFISILLSFAFFISTTAQQPERANEYLTTKGEVYFKFKVENVKTLKALSLKISIDKIDYENKEIYAYANQKGFDFFEGFDIPYEVLVPAGDLIKNPAMFSSFDRATMAWDSYPTYEAYEAMMYQYEIDYPGLCRIEEIGTTVEGRKILFAVISDNVSVNEAEPRFMYTSTMHGDETTGWIMMLRLIDYLLSNYGTNTQATNIVDNTELWINPLENPDGTYASGNSTVSGATRYNANGVDLNRNFKNQAYDHPDGEAWQPESILMMNLVDSIHFVMSANSHGGIELANYPWDTWTTHFISGNPSTNGYYTTHADQDWWIDLASEFRDYAQANSPVGYFTGENDGITHGADWYVVTGSRQDYYNYFGRCREMTYEVSETKLPAGSNLPSYWNYLYQGYLAYIEQVQYGFRGIVVDSLTLQPLYANIFINNHDSDQTDIYTELPFGDYYRPIKAGTYSVTYDANGYLSKTFDITVADYQTLIFDTVKLAPAMPSAQFSADFTEFCSAPSTVNFINQSVDASSFYWTFGDGGTSTLENPSHTYYNPGFYTVQLIIQGVFGGSDTISKTNFINIDASNPCSYDMPTSGTQTLTECGGFLYDDGGVSGVYSVSTTSSTTISVTGASFITVNVLDLDIEAGSGGSCDYDYIAFYDGLDNASPLINGTHYCNTTGNPGTIISTGSSITIELYSDENTTGAGFEIQWNCNYPTAPPVADFTTSVTESCLGVVQFYDLSTNGATSWEWNFGDGNTSNLQNPTHTYATNGIYTVSLTATNIYGDGVISYSDLITINRPAGPSITPQNICGVKSTTINANGQGTLYWYDESNGGNLLNIGDSYATPIISENTTYYVEDYIETSTYYNVGEQIVLANGSIFINSNVHYLEFDAYEEFKLNSVLVNADGEGERKISLRNSSGIEIQSISVNIPDGESRVTLNFDVPIGTNLQLAGPVSPYLFRSSTGTSYPYEISGIMSITNNSAGNLSYYYYFYDWEISQTTSCMSERTPVTVSVLDLPTLDLGSNIEVCEGESSVISTGVYNTYNWSTGATSSSINVSTSDTYSLTVTDNNNCEASDDVLFTVNPLPLASFSQVENGSEITFTNLSSNANTYTWNFGDGTFSNEANPVHTYASTNSFTVELTAENSCGTDNSSTTIIVLSNNDLSENNLVNIYPNPTNSNLYIETTDDYSSFEISDISGKIILSENIISSITKVDLTKYSKGMYFIKLSSNNKFLLKRFILD